MVGSAHEYPSQDKSLIDIRQCRWLECILAKAIPHLVSIKPFTCTLWWHVHYKWKSCSVPTGSAYSYKDICLFWLNMCLQPAIAEPQWLASLANPAYSIFLYPMCKSMWLTTKKKKVWLQFASLWSIICQPTAGKERQVTKLLGVKIILDFSLLHLHFCRTKQS